MRFLLSNDDGIDSPGLLILAQTMAELGEVYVVAPEKERSGGGHAITMHKPLRARPVLQQSGIHFWETSGTPADCVVIAVFDLLPQPPDLVISGINLGPNLGENLTYSGTVSAAMEAYLCDLPAFSISIDSFENPQWTVAAEVSKRLAGLIPLGHPLLLNVNVPNRPWSGIQGVQITRLGRRRYRDRLTKRCDPFGRTYYWVAGELEEDSLVKGTDSYAVHHGYISVTPISLDLTDYGTSPSLEPIRANLERSLGP